MNAWFGNYFFLVTKLESAYAVTTIFDDSDSEGGATSEIIDLVKKINFII